MTEYRVVVAGKTVWSHKAKKYEGLSVFPEEWRGRPPSGEVQLIVDDIVVATMRTEADDEASRQTEEEGQ